MSNPDVKDEAGDRAMLIERLLRAEDSDDPVFRRMAICDARLALSSDAKDQRIAELEARLADLAKPEGEREWLPTSTIDKLQSRAEAAEALSRSTGTEDAGVRALVGELRHLVSLNEPSHGGPYQGVAAQACMTAMTKAADALEQITRRT